MGENNVGKHSVDLTLPAIYNSSHALMVLKWLFKTLFKAKNRPQWDLNVLILALQFIF